jgi:hypothetical protein
LVQSTATWPEQRQLKHFPTRSTGTTRRGSGGGTRRAIRRHFLWWVMTCHPSDASVGGWPRAAPATNTVGTAGAVGAALRAPAARSAAVRPWDAAAEDCRASAMKPAGAPLGARPREGSGAASSAGAFPSRRTKGGDTSTKHDRGLELEPAAPTPEHSPRRTTSVKEVTGEALEG